MFEFLWAEKKVSALQKFFSLSLSFDSDSDSDHPYLAKCSSEIERILENECGDPVGERICQLVPLNTVSFVVLIVFNSSLGLLRTANSAWDKLTLKVD